MKLGTSSAMPKWLFAVLATGMLVSSPPELGFTRRLVGHTASLQ